MYDHLVGNGIMDLARHDARVIYAGKESSKHTMPQGDINQLLVELAREGLSVVRLKGGDPFISAAAAKNSKPWPLPASPSRSCPASRQQPDAPLTPAFR